MTLDLEQSAVDSWGNPRWATEGWRDGEPAAIEYLYGRYFEKIVAYLERMIYDAGDAEDLAGKTFLKAIERRHQFDGVNFTAWLYRVATNVALDWLRRKKTCLLIPAGLGRAAAHTSEGGAKSGAQHGAAGSADLLSWAADVYGPHCQTPPLPTEAVFERREMGLELRDALAGLDPTYAEVIRLRGGGSGRQAADRTYDEVGAILGLTRGAVKSLLYRAREQLARDVMSKPWRYPHLCQWARNHGTNSRARYGADVHAFDAA